MIFSLAPRSRPGFRRSPGLAGQRLRNARCRGSPKIMEVQIAVLHPRSDLGPIESGPEAVCATGSPKRASLSRDSTRHGGAQLRNRGEIAWVVVKEPFLNTEWEAAMAKCETCGNDYDKAFQVTMHGTVHTFDSFECAIHAL